MKRNTLFVLTMALVLYTLVAFTSRVGASSTTPQYGGILKVIFPYSPKAIGYPPKQSHLDLYSLVPCIETLTKRWPDKPVPYLASGWTVAPDGKSLTLTLRKGVKFHDNTEFDAEAVKYNLDLQLETGRPGIKMITSVDVVDDHTVRLNLSKYSNSLLYQLGWYGGIMVSPTSIKKHGVDWAITHGVGTGPFSPVEYKRGVILKYEKFDGYWDKGKPYLDGIEIRYIRNSMTAKASFMAGEAHLLWVSATRDPRIAYDIKQKGYKLAGIAGAVVGLIPDSNRAESPFAKKAVREALEYAIDRPAIAKGLSYGLWEDLSQQCHEGFPAYNPNLKAREYNPQKAMELELELRRFVASLR